ncbi:non-specific phospholipase C2-like [Triticum dicoccoides]|uniref:non-specific phospholipase C2-like n=1 Tax=Triticum dicoccoides TaxID=85692 RepID=UPI00188F24C7|nr:non-specific phospholipase C2-like [Triticum dicoccoides]
MAACAGDPACSLPWRPSLEVNDKLTGRAASRPPIAAPDHAAIPIVELRASRRLDVLHRRELRVADELLLRCTLLPATLPFTSSSAPVRAAHRRCRKSAPPLATGSSERDGRTPGDRSDEEVDHEADTSSPDPLPGGSGGGDGRGPSARGGGCSLLPIGSREGDREQGVDCFLFLDSGFAHCNSLCAAGSRSLMVVARAAEKDKYLETKGVILIARCCRSLAKGYPQRTIFDNVHDAGLSFGVYFQDVPTVLFYRNLRKLKYILNFHHFHNAFREHARCGSLPNYAVVEQRYMDSKEHPANDDHPSHDVYQGQMFVKEVYETLRASPQWNETLMILTYDEHGGFFDHVPTPVDGVPSPDDIIGSPPYNFAFNRLGVRVPAIMISPWIEKGTVVHGPNGSPTPTSQYEHSSIPATVKKLFNLPQDFLTKRDAWAGTFEGVVQTRTEPRTDCPEQLPMPKRIRQMEANEEAKLSSFQQEIVQLAAVLNGHHRLSSLQERIKERMNVREGTSYMRSAMRRFFEASMSAKKMGVTDSEHIIKMRPSLTTRTSSSAQDDRV